MITDLFRYPIKGLSGEPLESIRLVAGEGLAGDRALAIARDAALQQLSSFDGLSKNHFLMLMRDAPLALLDCSFAEDTQKLVVRKAGAMIVEGSMDDQDDRSRIEQFFKNYLADSSLEPTVVYCEGHKFTDISRLSDQKMRAISLVNLNSIRALESATGQAIDLRRFRANVYFDGVPAWEEFSWIEKTVAIGGASAKVVMRTTRCAATQVNPDTAERDINVPKEIRQHFGHADMGIYAEITETGDAAIGNPPVAVID